MAILVLLDKETSPPQKHTHTTHLKNISHIGSLPQG